MAAACNEKLSFVTEGYLLMLVFFKDKLVGGAGIVWEGALRARFLGTTYFS